MRIRRKRTVHCKDILKYNIVYYNKTNNVAIKEKVSNDLFSVVVPKAVASVLKIKPFIFINGKIKLPIKKKSLDKIRGKHIR